MHSLLNNFTGGEVTPQLDARLDLQRYASSCRTLENWRPSPYGGVHYRPGTTKIALTKGNGYARMLNFSFNTTTQYKLEFGQYYIRVYKNRAYLNVEIPTQYTNVDLQFLQFRQINSTLRIVHANYPPMILSCFSDTTWTMAPVVWTYPPLLDQNLTTITITPSATSGNITLLASLAIFNAGHVGSYWELAYKRDANNSTLDISASSGTTHSTPIQVFGPWSLTTAQYWYGTLQVERCIDGNPANLATSNWEVIRQFISKASRNISGSGEELANNWLRMTYIAQGNPFGTPPWVGTPPATYVPAQVVLETSQVFVPGIVKITSFTDTTHVDAIIVAFGDTQNPSLIPTLPSSAPCQYWSEAAFSVYRGYPRTIGMYQQRLLYGGTSSRPNTVWGSVTGDFDNIQYSSADDAAVMFQMADSQQNAIQWMATLRSIHLGTQGDEQLMNSGNMDEALSPNNITVRRESSYGSEYLPVIQLDQGVIFLQRQGRRLRELREMSMYGNPSDFTCPDLTLYAEHITLGGLIYIDFARLPDPQIFTIRQDGQMPVLTYNREQNVLAWARYITSGTFENVCTGYGTPNDEIWVIVNRNGNRVIEVFDAEADSLTSNYLDSSVSYTGTNGGSLTFTGLDHLNGYTVSAKIDGALYEGLVVSAGAISLPANSTPMVATAVIGLPYTATFQAMKLDSMAQDGPTLGVIKRINEFSIRVKNTIGLIFGTDPSTQMDDIDWRQAVSQMDAPPGLYTGEYRIPWNGINNSNADVYIQQNKPYPATILSINPTLKLFK